MERIDGNETIFCGECYQRYKPQRTKLKICITCQRDYLIKDFYRWTTGNLNIDKLIKRTQIELTDHVVLEWIEWKDLDLFEYCGKGFFGKIYSAYWFSGPFVTWDQHLECYVRNGPIKVAIKKFDDSQEFSQEFLDKLYEFHLCTKNNYIVDFFGITRDDESNYSLVLKYEDENIYKFLEESSGLLCWRDIVEIIWLIADGLKCIHHKGVFHGNLHCGNVLIDNTGDIIDVRITDVGLNIWANDAIVESSNKKKIYGVLPFVAPEVLLGDNYTSASDIYSFGIMMWTLASGIPPFSDIAHDENLAREITVKEKRPKITENTFPEVFIDLMRNCWESDPKRRPTAQKLFEITGKWVSDICDNPSPNETSRQFDDAEEKKFSKFEKTPFTQSTIHPLAFYTGRPLDFPGICST